MLTSVVDPLRAVPPPPRLRVPGLRELMRHGPLIMLAGAILAQLMPWGSLGLNLTVVSDLLIFGSCVLGMLIGTRKGYLGELFAPLFITSFVGVSLAVLSAMNVSSLAESGQGLFRIVEVFVVFPAAVILAVRTRRHVVIALGAISSLVFCQCLYGAWQFATRSGALIGGEPIRAVGTFGASNIGALASMAVSGVVIGLAFFVTHTGRRRLMAGLLVLVTGTGLVLSLSRSAWITALAASAVVVSRLNWRRALVILGVGALLAGAVPPLVADSEGPLAARFASLSEVNDQPDQSVIDRYSLWEAAGKMINSAPLLGVGPRQFPAHRDANAPLALLGSSDIGSAGVFERQALLSPHNLYFLLASELGIPAATCFSLLIFGSIVLCGVLVIRAGAHDRLRTATGLAAIGMLIGVAIDGLFGDLGGPSVISMGWAIGLGVCFSRGENMRPWVSSEEETRRDAPEEGRSTQRRRQRLVARRWVGAVLLTAGLGTLAGVAHYLAFPPTYQVSAVVVVAPREVRSAANSQTALTQLRWSQALARLIVQPEVLTEPLTRASRQGRAREVMGGLTTSAAPDAPVFTITARLPDPDEAVRAVDTAVTTLAELSERNKLPVATHTLGRATIGAPPSPPLAMRVVLGGSVGAAFGLLWAMVKLPPRPARARR